MSSRQYYKCARHYGANHTVTDFIDVGGGVLPQRTVHSSKYCFPMAAKQMLLPFSLLFIYQSACMKCIGKCDHILSA